MRRTALTRAGFVALLAAGIGVASAGRPVHESLASVAVRAQRIVVAEIVAVDEFDEGTSRSIDIEATAEQLMAGPAFESDEEAALLCRYTEQRVQRRGDAVLSPLVSGSGEEFRARRGDRVILLLAAAPKAATPTNASAAAQADGADEAEPGSDDEGAVDPHAEAQPATPTCELLRIESLQNRIAILRALRHAAEARGQHP